MTQSYLCRLCAKKGRRVDHWQSVALTWQKRGFNSFRAYQRSSPDARDRRIRCAGISGLLLLSWRTQPALLKWCLGPSRG